MSQISLYWTLFSHGIINFVDKSENEIVPSGTNAYHRVGMRGLAWTDTATNFVITQAVYQIWQPTIRLLIRWNCTTIISEVVNQSINERIRSRAIEWWCMLVYGQIQSPTYIKLRKYWIRDPTNTGRYLWHQRSKVTCSGRSSSSIGMYLVNGPGNWLASRTPTAQVGKVVVQMMMPNAWFSMEFGQIRMPPEIFDLDKSDLVRLHVICMRLPLNLITVCQN